MNSTLTFDCEGMGADSKYEIEKKQEWQEEKPRWPAESPKHEHDWANTLKPDKETGPNRNFSNQDQNALVQEICGAIDGNDNQAFERLYDQLLAQEMDENDDSHTVAFSSYAGGMEDYEDMLDGVKQKALKSLPVKKVTKQKEEHPHCVRT